MRRIDRRRALTATAGLALAAVSSPALAQLRVDINRGRVEPVPIAVSPFAATGAGDRSLGDSIAQVVSDDLEGSGLFRVIDRNAYIQAPDEMLVLPRFADWRQIDAQALVTGQVDAEADGRLAVEFRLWDIYGGNQLRGLRLNGPPARWRRLAHQIADAVYERLTGEKGYFDSKIVYVAETGPATRLVKRLAMMDQDGADHAFLTSGQSLVLTPRLSPDLQRLAYVSYQQRVPRIALRDLASGREQVLPSGAGMSFSPRFAPDGRTMLMTIAESGNSDIFTYDQLGGRTTRLTSGGAIDTSPSFSPDGREIVFNSDRGGSPQLYVMRADGSGARRISFGDGIYGMPEWSPKGDFLAFTNIKRGYFHIGVMRADGSDERLLTQSFLDEGPSWAPNGRVIVFSRENRETNGRRLFTIDLSGYNERPLLTPNGASDPDWSPLLP